MVKTVLVTGGSSGIGAGITKRFAQKGYKVYFTYNSGEERAREIALETGAEAVKLDIGNADEIHAVCKSLPRLDVLVNNAGVSLISLFTDGTDEQVSRVLDVNLRGAMLLTREVLPKMISEKSGRIVNISSMWGIVGGSCEVAYSASKAGIIGFTKALAKEVGPSGITVNAVAPGFIDTPMNRELDQTAVDGVVEETPLCRVGTVEDVVGAVEFLADGKSDFITGAVIPVDGGITA